MVIDAILESQSDRVEKLECRWPTCEDSVFVVVPRRIVNRVRIPVEPAKVPKACGLLAAENRDLSAAVRKNVTGPPLSATKGAVDGFLGEPRRARLCALLKVNVDSVGGLCGKGMQLECCCMGQIASFFERQGQAVGRYVAPCESCGENVFLGLQCYFFQLRFFDEKVDVDLDRGTSREVPNRAVLRQENS